MIKINFSKQSLSFLKKLSKNDAFLLWEKILFLRKNPEKIISKALQWHKPLRRIRAWWYRIVYFIEEEILYISFIWKRNNDEVYRKISKK